MTTTSSASTTPTKDMKENAQEQQQQQHSAVPKNSLKLRHQQQEEHLPMLPVIPCGTVVPVEQWDQCKSSKVSFLYLCSVSCVQQNLIIIALTYRRALPASTIARVGSLAS